MPSSKCFLSGWFGALDPNHCSFGQNNFAYRGAKIWNSLPNECRKAHTLPTLKRKLKAMIA